MNVLTTDGLSHFTQKVKSLIDAITIPTKVSELENDSGYLTEKDIGEKSSEINNVTGELFNTFTEIGRHTRSASGTDAEQFTLTLSESMTNFVMVYMVVMSMTQDDTRSYTYLLGSSFVPVDFFKLGYILELNAINDCQDLFGGNIEYVSDTSVSGKVVGYTSQLRIYGIGRIA